MHGLKIQGIDAIETLKLSNIGIIRWLWGIDDIGIMFERLFQKFQSWLTPKLQTVQRTPTHPLHSR